MMILIISLGLIFSIMEGVMKSWGAMAYPAPPPEPALSIQQLLKETQLHSSSRGSGGMPPRKMLKIVCSKMVFRVIFHLNYHLFYLMYSLVYVTV